MDEERLQEQDINEQDLTEETSREDAFKRSRRRKERKGLKGSFARARAYRGQAAAAFLVLVGALLFYYFLHSLPFFARGIKKLVAAMAPAIWGFCIAFLMNPIVRFLEKHFIRFGQKRKPKKDETPEKREARIRGRSRGFAILITVVMVITLLTLLFVAVIPEFLSSIGTLIENIPEYGAYVREFMENLISRNKVVEDALTPVIENFTKGLEDFLSNRLTDIMTMSAGLLKNAVTATLKLVFNLLIGLIFAIYMMKDKEYLIGLAKKIIFAIFPKKTAKVTVQTLHKANGIFSTAILGKILDSAIIGMICFIGTNILGFFFELEGIAQYKGLVSIVIGVTNVIPFFGPFIGGIPCAFLIFCVHPLDGLIFALFILVLQQFDGNYLDPHIVGKKVGMKPIYVLLACTVFSKLWGILGMLIAVPTFALVYSILKSYLEVKLVEKNLPKDTASYITTPGAILAKESGGAGTMLSEITAAAEEAAETAEEMAEAMDIPEEELPDDKTE
ncbi:MAG: AI-2E family transporter [Lachnospiraceae bacterium]|nr:AI-2E family transporter [Lachnospiraceae bacterium]